MPDRLRVGLVGAGVFGGYHAGKIAGADTVLFAGVFDEAPARAQQLATTHSTCASQALEDLLDTSDAIIIATPAETHARLTRQALLAGCHVLVEKPLAITGKEAHALASLSEERGLVLQVGHQERLVCNALGLFDIEVPPLQFHSVRAGPPPPGGRAMDVSVIWDLMIHDIDLAHILMGEQMAVQSAFGLALQGDAFDKAEAVLRASQGDARLLASRAESHRVRTLSLTFQSGKIDVDFLSRRVENSTGFYVNERFGELVSDPLGAADLAFFQACCGEIDCIIPGKEAAMAVAMAEKVEELAHAKMGTG